MRRFIQTTDLNPQKHEILNNPGIDATCSFVNQTIESPTEDDKARAWSFARTTEYIDRRSYSISHKQNLPQLDEITQSESTHRIPEIIKAW
ncbi:hypothetical protein GGP41_008278 [Bipolaris sorokiniana]|uniref:Uncharacterized protein n=1 Tax=Cochliobolus sativus TaxID=45130 RepID=A0A8H5ZRG6_COCSA|nr:hypothetical protein GGP41_008278 [Bipolaris sorokiniana]